jgi:hypothetical protein
MLSQTFDWNGAHFEVRPMSGMDKELYTFVLADVADAICQDRNLSIETLPRTLDKLIVTFTKWALVTTVTDSDLPVCNLLLDNPVAYFDAWVKAVTTDQDLWRLWSAAFEGANRIDNSPLEVVTAPVVVSE